MTAPEKIYLSCADADNYHEVWFDPDDGGTEYIRSDLCDPDAIWNEAIEAVAQKIESGIGLTNINDHVRALKRQQGDGNHLAPGTRVRKTRGSNWQGRIVGRYSTSLTPEGYAVESEREPGSVQIYPRSALEVVNG